MLPSTPSSARPYISRLGAAAPSIACFYSFHYSMPLLRWIKIEHALPVSRNEGVEVDQLGDPVASAISDPSGNHTAVTMTNENDIIQIFILDDPEHVLNVGFEIV